MIQLAAFFALVAVLAIACEHVLFPKGNSMSPAECRSILAELDAIGVRVAEHAISSYGPAADDDHLLRTAIGEIFTELPRVPDALERRILCAAQDEIQRRTAS